MAKLTIEITGTHEEISELIGHMSDGGGEEGLTPAIFETEGKYIDFDYSYCMDTCHITGIISHEDI